VHTFIASLLIAQPHLNGGGRGDTVGFKLAEGKGLQEGWSRKGYRDAKSGDSKELWKSVEKGSL